MKRRVTALVAAAGVGSRLGLGPKAFLELGGESLLTRVTGMALMLADRVIAAVPETHLDHARTLVDSRVDVMAGGTSRQESFGLMFAKVQTDLVLLLDISRPLVSVDLARRVLDAATIHGAAGTFVPGVVPAARIDAEGFVRDPVPATQYHLPQMPQAFRRDVLARVLADASDRMMVRQTLWQLAVELGVPMKAVEGDHDNIKITHPNDWRLARLIVAERHSSQIEKEQP